MRTLTLVVVLACVGASYGQVVRDSDSESKIIALERLARVQAYATKDLKTLDTILDTDFVYVDPNGLLLTKSEVLANVKAVDSLQTVTEAMVVRLHGDTAIVTGLYRMEGAERGKPFVRRGRFVDTWLHRDKRWVEIASLWTPVED